MLNEIVSYIKEHYQVNDWIISEDINQDINSHEITNFFQECRVEDIHHKHNNIPLNQLDNTHITGSKYADTIVATESILEVIERCKLV